MGTHALLASKQRKCDKDAGSTADTDHLRVRRPRSGQLGLPEGVTLDQSSVCRLELLMETAELCLSDSGSLPLALSLRTELCKLPVGCTASGGRGGTG